jgi:hypothetical protein
MLPGRLVLHPQVPTAVKLLDPMERISEILFGLVMILTVTCSFSIGGGGKTETPQMLIGALGSNFAWAVIDAIMYLMDTFSAHGREIRALRAVREAATPTEAHAIIRDAMPSPLPAVTSPTELEAMRVRMKDLPAPPDRPRLATNDWLAAFGVFLLVQAAMLPVTLPFVFVEEAKRAVRISNEIAILMLFVTGYAYGHYAGYRPWKMAVGMVFLGLAMVALTIALGG